MADGRLHSWKEIAEHLNHSVSSVQRWERQEGLPVHRHHHEKKGTVWAYSDELNRWWVERGPNLESREGLSAAKGPSRLRFVLAAAAILAIILAFGLQRLGTNHPDRLIGNADARPIESVAVLPLENLSGNPEEEYFADGMTEAIIIELGRIDGLRVISRQSILRYKRTDAPLSDIARDLDVDALVEGTILRAGARVRVTAQLIRAVPESHIWAETYEGRLEDVIELQRRIARSVAREAHMALAPAEEARLAHARTVNTEVYELYLKGRYQWSGYRVEDLKKSIEYFQRALDLDPDFAPAYVGLAEAYIAGGAYEVAPHEHAELVKASIARALALDQTSDEAHRLSALLAFHQDWNWDFAERELERALRINPSSAAGYDQYANLLLVLGRVKEAVAARRKSLELDPLSHYVSCNAGFTYYWAGLYDEAESRARQNLELFGRSCPSEYLVIGKAFGQRGLYEDGIACLRRSPDPTSTQSLAELSYLHAVSGRRDEAQKILSELKSRPEAESVNPFLLAQVYVGLEDGDAALSALEAAYEERSFGMPWLGVEPKFVSLRSEPRFQELLRRMKLPQ